MTPEERKELALEALELMVRLLPPDEFGEDEYCDHLQHCIMELGGLVDADLKDL